MFCKNCGKQIADDSVYCSYCGANQQNSDTRNTQNPYQNTQQRQNQQHYTQQTPPPYYVQDAPNAGFAFLSFLFPIVGLILYLIWKDFLPQRAHSCGKGALIGFVIYIILTVLTITLYLVLPHSPYYYVYVMNSCL